MKEDPHFKKQSSPPGPIKGRVQLVAAFLTFLSLGLFISSIHFGRAKIDKPYPGYLTFANGVVGSFYLPSWSGAKEGIRYPAMSPPSQDSNEIFTEGDFYLTVLLPALTGLLFIFFGAGMFFYLSPRAGLFPIFFFHFLAGNLLMGLPEIQLTHHFSYFALACAVLMAPAFIHFTLFISEIFVDSRKYFLFYVSPYLAGALIFIPYLYSFLTRPLFWVQINYFLIFAGIFVYLFWIYRLFRILKNPHLELDRINARFLLKGQAMGLIPPFVIAAALFLGGISLPLNIASPLFLFFPISLLIGVIPSQRQQRDTYVVQSEKRSTFGNLMSGLAHELNNPMTFIYSNLEPIRENLKDLQNLLPSSDPKVQNSFQKLERMITRVEEGVSRARTLIENFRKFPNPRAESKEEVDLPEIIDQSVEMLSPKWTGRIRIEKNYDTIPKIRGYASELGQVFTNLLANAFDAIIGEGVVSIHAKKGAGGVKVLIHDTGPGIPTEKMGKIFDPFFTTKEQGKGTGLGLSIALQLVMNHKGSIEVKSKAGEGTNFIVFLPF